MIVDPEPLFAHGVAAALSGVVHPDPVVGAWETPVAWPGPSGVAVVGVRRHVGDDTGMVLTSLKSGTPTVVLGVPASEQAVVGLLRAGAREILARDCSPAELVAALRGLLRRPAASRRAPAAGPTDPTARELEVTALLAQGLSNREIANALFISEHTVRNHLCHVFSKLGASSRTQAVVRAGQVGWLQLPV